MSTVKLYIVDSGRITIHDLPIVSKMPQSKYLSVKEFMGSSQSSFLWTDIRLIKAFDQLRTSIGSPIPVKYGFKRIREGGHSNNSQHYAGLALDCMQASFGKTDLQRAAVRAKAKELGLFRYIEPATLSPTWVHVDVRHDATIKTGSVSVYNFVLQDALDYLGYAMRIDGVFGPATEAALILYQKASRLSADGVCGYATWAALGKSVARKRGDK